MTWYFGALKAIMEVRGGEPVVFASFSSGALACAVFLCKLKHETAAKRYTEMMDERRVSQRLFGLAFIWGDITRQWLEEILPEDAHELCEGSLVVHVLEWRGMLSGFKMRRVKHFPDRATLIQTLLASCHIPFYLDGRTWTTLTTTSGDLPHGTFKAIDSVIMHVLRMVRSETAKIKYRISTDTERKADITVSFTFDESLKDGPGRLDIINYEHSMELRDKGYQHTLARLESPKYSYLITNNV